MTGSHRTAAVIGAGQNGVTAALGLLDAGFAVTLYSDRDQRALRDDVPATGTALIFGEAQDAETALGLDTYRDRAPLHTGLSARVVGPEKAELIGFDGAFDGYVGVAVDTRLKADERLTAFRERGGEFVVEDVDPEKLDRIAGSHDLTLVSTGRGGLAEVFPLDSARTVYDSPQRSLLTVTVAGLGFDSSVFAHRSPAGGTHSGFSILPEGEAWWGPYLHKDAGPTWAFLGWAKPGTDWEQRFAQAHDAASAHRIATELYRDYIDWDLPEVLATTVLDDDPHSWLKGAVRPVVRAGVGHTSAGHPVAAIGDTAVAHDPIAGQGAQGGLVQVQRLVQAAREHDGPFDAAWLAEQYNGFLAARADGATKVTRLFLSDPELADYANILFPAAQVNPAVAGALVGLLNRPSQFVAIDSEDAVGEFVAAAAGESVADVLARFAPVGRFARSEFANPLTPA